MPGSRRLAALAAATVLLLAVIAFAARGGLGGSDASGEQAAGSGSTSGSSSGPSSGSGSGSGSGSSESEADASDGNGDDGATETRNDPPPTTGPAAERAEAGKELPGIGRKGELVPVETASGPGETSGSKGSKKSGSPALAVDTGPLVDEPLPKSASSRGRLVRGYPAKALPVVPGSKVRSSSVASSERGLQVAVVGSVPRRAEAVAAFYRLALAPYGFEEASAPAVGGSTAYGFTRSKDSLVLTITSQGKRSTYSLFGTLSAGSD